MSWKYIMVFLTVCFLACKPKHETMEIVVENIRLFDSIPSGSGLAADGDFIYIIGDDATSLYQYSLTTEQFTSIPLLNTDSTLYRIDKPKKHDLEAVTIAQTDNKKYLLAFGSGSVSPYRDSLLVITLDNPHHQQWISLHSLYEYFRKISKAKELNIEGATIMEASLYLFNRSGNEVFELKTSDLIQLIDKKGKHTFTAISRRDLNIPEHASLSGGCIVNNKILFCASAENTSNAYDDGELLGSYIGIADPLNDLKVLQFIPLTNKGITLKDKLESLDIVETYDHGDLKVIAIADNDDGRSKLFELRIRY